MNFGVKCSLTVWVRSYDQIFDQGADGSTITQPQGLLGEYRSVGVSSAVPDKRAVRHGQFGSIGAILHDSGVCFLYQARQFGQVRYFTGAFGEFFAGVGVGGFQYRLEADY